MKTMKKLASAALALVMALCLTVPAFATAPQTGSITVTNAVPGQTYTIYKLFDLAYGGAGVENESDQPEAEGSHDPHTYSILSNSDWFGFVNPEGGDAATGKGYVTLTASTENVGEGITKYYVAWNTGDAAEFAKAALAYAKANNIASAKPAETAPAAAEGATTSTVTFSELELGYYLIDSSLGALCALDTTNFNANIREKNEKPTDKKESEMPENSKVGSEVKYTVTINAKKGAQAYVVHDTMDAGLTFNNDVKVHVGETEIDGTNYTVTTENTDGCTFELAFDQDYLDTLTGDTTILITYTATINANAVIGKDPITNKEILSYGDGNKTVETPGNTTEDKFYDFNLVKTTSKNELLEGAVFQLKDSDGVIKLVQNTDGTYRPAVASDAAENVLETITTGTSVITFTGFAPGTYTLEEVTAPGGYNKLKAPITIQIAQKKDEAGQPMVDTNGNPVMTLYMDGGDRGFTATVTSVENPEENGIKNTVEGGIQVVNLTGAELPETGGIGTTIFYIVGGLLAVGAGVLLVTKKKMGSTDEE